MPTFTHWTHWANEPSGNLVFDTDLHGTFLLAPFAPQDQVIPSQLAHAFLQFLDQYA